MIFIVSQKNLLNIILQKKFHTLGVNANTIHTSIRRDSSMRYDLALRLSHLLGIDIKLICRENPYSQTKTDSLSETDGLLSALNTNSALKNRMFQILNLYSYSDYPLLDQLLTQFYILDEEGRRQVLDNLEVQMKRHTDSKYEKQLKQIQHIQIEGYKKSPQNFCSDFSFLLPY